jgi:hypothetical protein
LAKDREQRHADAVAMSRDFAELARAYAASSATQMSRPISIAPPSSRRGETTLTTTGAKVATIPVFPRAPEERNNWRVLGAAIAFCIGGFFAYAIFGGAQAAQRLPSDIALPENERATAAWRPSSEPSPAPSASATGSTAASTRTPPSSMEPPPIPSSAAR